MTTSSPNESTQNSLFKKIKQSRRRPTKMSDSHITLAHGSGGKAMRNLIEDIFVSNFDNSVLSQLEDQATFELKNFTEHGDKLAFTTDSYVISPLFFPGGNIGELAVHGTVNDLAVSGAKPLYLSCGMIIEAGFPTDSLRKIVKSMKRAADEAGVKIVTGDTKVVHRGAADQLFINTAGVGVIRSGISMSAQKIQVGDSIIVNGYLGDHGAAILLARKELDIQAEIESDTQALNGLVDTILDVCMEVRGMRDVTRGGLATVLNEFAMSSKVGIRLFEKKLPVREKVSAVCEILGLDPLYFANEGKLVTVVPPDKADTVLKAMQSHPAGIDSAIVGEVFAPPSGSLGLVCLKNKFDTERVIDMLTGDQLPRIC